LQESNSIASPYTRKIQSENYNSENSIYNNNRRDENLETKLTKEAQGWHTEN
jgi:hypothetical protein